MRSFVAFWRLLRAVLHLAHGALIVELRFSRYDAARREARIAWWSAKLLHVLGLQRIVTGTLPLADRGMLVVGNHVSWLDIAAIHAVLPRAHFVSRADVLRWPVIGTMVAGAGTLFIERERKRDALRVVGDMARALAQCQSVAVFPEAQVGTGHNLQSFHANLFHAVIDAQADVLPMCLVYSDRTEAVSAATYYLGETTLLQSAWRIASAKGLVIAVDVLPVLRTQGKDRRGLAAEARDVIARAHRVRVAAAAADERPSQPRPRDQPLQ